MKILLLAFFIAGASYANDIIFSEPVQEQSLKGKVLVQVQPPLAYADVHVWIETSGNKILWRGKLTSANNYTTTVNVKGMSKGRHKLKAVHYVDSLAYESSVNIWVD